MVVQLVWFKRDLRTADHRPLVAAAQQGPVLPLFIVERELWQQQDMAARHWNFVSESLVELQRALAALGAPLVVMTGDAIETLEHIHTRLGIGAIWSHEETGNAWTFARDVRVAAWARAEGIQWHEVRQTGVIRRLRSRNGWAQAWDAAMATPVVDATDALEPINHDLPHAIPTSGDLGLTPDACLHRQIGGRDAGFNALHSFLAERGRDYRTQMSSPVTAADACSRISPHLAWGTLSMREVAQTTWARRRQLKSEHASDTAAWRGSVNSFSARLHWHCHFMQKLEDEPRLEFENLHRAYNGLRPEIADAERLQAWAQGETGYPFVDACMRALHQQGWINFRMRAMLMSFASYQLWLPWRDTGLHLARQFTDYEPGIHWPQVQMQSGTTGINTMRIYNPIKQGYDQDPDGSFVRTYLPELASVPDAFIHEPWRWPDSGSLLGRAYPAPIVDNVIAAKAARDALYGVRKRPDHRSTARSIAEKHGSRKSGMTQTGVRPPRRRAPAEDVQLGFDL